MSFCAGCKSGMRDRAGRWCLEVGDGGYDLSADDLQRRYPVYVRDDADHGLDPNTGEPAYLLDQLACFLAVLSHVEGEGAGLLDLGTLAPVGAPQRGSFAVRGKKKSFR